MVLQWKVMNGCVYESSCVIIFFVSLQLTFVGLMKGGSLKKMILLLSLERVRYILGEGGLG